MTKTEAEKLGKESLSKMKDPNWKLRVWENRDWHCTIQNGPLSIVCRPSKKGPYYSLLMSDEAELPGGGLSMWTPEKITSSIPTGGIKKQVRLARKVVNGMLKAVESAEAILKNETGD